MGSGTKSCCIECRYFKQTGLQSSSPFDSILSGRPDYGYCIYPVHIAETWPATIEIVRHTVFGRLMRECACFDPL